jgi:hypothetical protein
MEEPKEINFSNFSNFSKNKENGKGEFIGELCKKIRTFNVDSLEDIELEPTMEDHEEIDFSNFSTKNNELVKNLQKGTPEVGVEVILSDGAFRKEHIKTKEKKRKRNSVLSTTSRPNKKSKQNFDFKILNECYLTWIKSLNPQIMMKPQAPSGCHVFKAYVEDISDEIPDYEKYYFGVCEPQNFSQIGDVDILEFGQQNCKNYSICKQNHKEEPKILTRCFCGIWGTQSVKKTHGCPYHYDFEVKGNKIYIKLKNGKEFVAPKGFQFFLVDSLASDSKENLYFNKKDSEGIFAEFVNKSHFNETFIKCRHLDTRGLLMKIKKVKISNTAKSPSTPISSTPKSSNTLTLYSRLVDFSKKCSVIYMLILHCSLNKIDFETMKNDYMITSDDLINERDSDDLKKDYFDFDEKASLGKNGLFWLIFLNKDDSNLLEKLESEFNEEEFEHQRELIKKEIEHQMKYVEKYSKVDNIDKLIGYINELVVKYRFGFNQSIEDYIKSLEEEEIIEKIKEEIIESSIVKDSINHKITPEPSLEEEIPRKFTGNILKREFSPILKIEPNKEETISNEISKKYKSGYLADSLKHLKTFFVQESNLGFFKKETNNIENIINNMKNLSMDEELSPTNVMLHQQDSSILLLDKSRVFQFDIESKKIVDEWTAPESVPILSILPKSKFSQRTDEKVFIGMNKKTIFGMDPRINKKDKSIGDFEK